MNQIKLLMRQAWVVGLDLVFPPVCVHCERVGSLLCPHCVAAIRPAAPRTLPGIDGIWLAGQYEEAIRDAVHALKYHGQTRLGPVLGDLLADAFAGAVPEVDLVVGVPLSEQRLRERGYNQAKLIAQRISERLAIPEEPTALRRIKQTQSQVELNADERRRNVAGAFAADPPVVRGKSVLVIDDVLTTGATMTACMTALRAAGAVHVYVAAVGGAGCGQDR